MNSKINNNNIIKIDENNWTTDTYDVLNGHECDDQYVEEFMTRARATNIEKQLELAKKDEKRMIISELSDITDKRYTDKYIKVRVYSKSAIITDLFKNSFFYIVIKDYKSSLIVKCIKQEEQTAEQFHQYWRFFQISFGYKITGFLITKKNVQENPILNQLLITNLIFPLTKIHNTN